MPYIITDYTLQKAKQMKVTVQLSEIKNKKLDVFKNDVKIATIGDSRYKDFPTYVIENGIEFANQRKRLYYIKDIKRHKKDIEKLNSNGFYAAKLLW